MSLRALLNKVHHIDCIDFLKKIPDNTVDSCVTDPPYGIDFMGASWDSGSITFNDEMWDLVRRALKPGGHLLAFGSTRTYHRLASAIEDAGFEIRDQIHWLYGSGFPKGQNISKMIDRKAGYEQSIIGRQETARPVSQGDFDRIGKVPFATEVRDGSMSNPEQQGVITKPVTEEAIQWEGWNTQLKPAHEPIVIARKPLGEKTIVDNILKWGVGAINIDGCRVAVNPDVDDMDKTVTRKPRVSKTWEDGSGFKNEDNPRMGVLPSGRYPANLILSHHPDCTLVKEGIQRVKSKPRDRYLKTGEHPVGKYGIYNKGLRSDIEIEYDDSDGDVWECVDDCPVRMLNEQSGITVSRGGFPINLVDARLGWKGSIGPTTGGLGDIGGAARFFYCAKAYKRERDAGLKGHNIHITVKPIEIVRWLVRLVTPRGGLVLDPFLGSGTTAIAAENEGMKWLGSEINATYCEIARSRIHALGGPTEQ